MQIYFVAPTGFGVGLTSTSLGLLRALEQGGLKVGFCKPIAQHHPGDTGPERSSELITRTFAIEPPEPMPLEQTEKFLGEGQLDDLLEHIVQRFHQAAEGKDVMVVEGMVPTRTVSYAGRLNAELASSLGAEVILVAAPEDDNVSALADSLEIHCRQFGGSRNDKVLGVVLNKVRDKDLPERLKNHFPALKKGELRLLGCVPWREELNALRTRDVAKLLGATVLHAGDDEHRRMEKIVLCARALPNTVELFQPRVLVVTPRRPRRHHRRRQPGRQQRRAFGRAVAVHRLPAGPAGNAPVPERTGCGPAGDDGRDRLLRNRHQPESHEPGNPGGRQRASRKGHQLCGPPPGP